MKLFGREIKKENIDVDKLMGSSAFRSMFGVNMDKKDVQEATLTTCLKILSDAVSKLPIKVHNNNSEADHYLNDLLRLRPNKMMSASTLWRIAEYQRSYYGYSMMAIEKDINEKVISLIPLQNEGITIYVDDKGLLGDQEVPLLFTYEQGDDEYEFRYDEVLYFVGLTEDGVTPIPLKDRLQTIIDNAKEANRYTNFYLKNGLHSRGVVKYIGDLSEEKQTELQARMTRVAGGIEKAGQLLPLPIGFDYQSISTSMADSQFVELQQLTERQIASAFGIKMHQLNSLERSTHNNIEHQQKEFYMDTLQPILTAYEQEMTYKLLTDKEISEGFFIRFNVDAILRSDLKTRYEAYNIGIQSGMLTPNEPREKENLEPMPGGDNLYFNGNMIPIEQAGNQYLKGGDANGQDGN